MNSREKTLSLPKHAVIGMLHTPALPGTPYNQIAMSAILDHVRAEAATLAAAGFDALILENMHDTPYLLREVGPEIVAAMTAAGAAVRGETGLPLGIQVLAGANRAALAVALACGADFVRAEGFVFAHVADEGLMAEADAGPLLRYRRQIGAEHITVFADIKKKHAAHALTADVDLADTARAAAFFGADGVIVTGTATGTAAQPADVQAASAAVEMPVWVGSGVTPDNLEAFWLHADAAIVGSYLKEDGRWSNPLDPKRLATFRRAVENLRSA